MAIAKRPDRNRSTIEVHPEDERAAEAFITGAEEAPPPKYTKKVPILVRFDRELLERVDRAAKRRGISRSGWVHYQISRALEEEEG
jgi:predicted HicB family RNase H-like nuclease